MLNDEIKKKSIQKNNLSQPGLSCQTRDPSNEIGITQWKTN